MPFNGQPNFPSSQPAANGDVRRDVARVSAGPTPSASSDVAVAPVAPKEQFYETKLFRVVVSRTPWVKGHVVIERKEGDPHLYSFSTDAMDELGYLLKKVSFWVMRLTGAGGFTMLMHDGTSEVHDGIPLQVHVLPRGTGGEDFSAMAGQSKGNADGRSPLNDAEVQMLVVELRDLMQLPQE